MLEAITFVGFVVLALVYLVVLGVPLGIVAWLLTYGLFRFLARLLLTRIGEPTDLYGPTRPPTPTEPVSSANTRHRPRTRRGRSF